MINFRYRIVRPLGEGGSGIVYLVEDRLRGDLPFALKALHPQGHPGPEGERIFAELRQEYMDRYFVRPTDNPRAEIAKTADLEYGVADSLA